jgi:hypothetical protein
MPVYIHTMTFWGVATCRLVYSHQYFEPKYTLHLQFFTILRQMLDYLNDHLRLVQQLLYVSYSTEEEFRRILYHFVLIRTYILSGTSSKSVFD